MDYCFSFKERNLHSTFSFCSAFSMLCFRLDSHLARPPAYHWHSLTTSLLEAETNRAKIVLSLFLAISFFSPLLCAVINFFFPSGVNLKKSSRERSKGHRFVMFQVGASCAIFKCFSSKLYFTKYM